MNPSDRVAGEILHCNVSNNDNDIDCTTNRVASVLTLDSDDNNSNGVTGSIRNTGSTGISNNKNILITENNNKRRKRLHHKEKYMRMDLGPTWNNQDLVDKYKESENTRAITAHPTTMDWTSTMATDPSGNLLLTNPPLKKLHQNTTLPLIPIPHSLSSDVIEKSLSPSVLLSPASASRDISSIESFGEEEENGGRKLGTRRIAVPTKTTSAAGASALLVRGYWGRAGGNEADDEQSDWCPPCGSGAGIDDPLSEWEMDNNIDDFLGGRCSCFTDFLPASAVTSTASFSRSFFGHLPCEHHHYQQGQQQVHHNFQNLQQRQQQKSPASATFAAPHCFLWVDDRRRLYRRRLRCPRRRSSTTSSKAGDFGACDDDGIGARGQHVPSFFGGSTADSVAAASVLRGPTGGLKVGANTAVTATAFASTTSMELELVSSIVNDCDEAPTGCGGSAAAAVAQTPPLSQKVVNRIERFLLDAAERELTLTQMPHTTPIKQMLKSGVAGVPICPVSSSSSPSPTNSFPAIRVLKRGRSTVILNKLLG